MTTNTPPPGSAKAVALLRTLVERLHLPPEQVLFVALERLYVQYPTGEMLDGGPVEYAAQGGDA